MMMFYTGVHWDSNVEKASHRAERNGSITPKKEVEDMAVKTSDESKPKQPLFVVGDKLSIAHAMAKGYRITLDGDGDAEVINGVASFVTRRRKVNQPMLRVKC